MPFASRVSSVKISSRFVGGVSSAMLSPYEKTVNRFDRSDKTSFRRPLRRQLQILLDRIRKRAGMFPSRSGLVKSDNAFSIDQNVKRELVDAESPLHVMVPIKVLRPDHLIP